MGDQAFKPPIDLTIVSVHSGRYLRKTDYELGNALHDQHAVGYEPKIARRGIKGCLKFGLGAGRQGRQASTLTVWCVRHFKSPDHAFYLT